MSTQKYNSSVPFPKDSNYIVRTLAESFAPSNAGHPMITLEHEIVYPETVIVGDQEYTIAGTKIKTRHVCMSMDGDSINEKKTETCKKFIDALYKAYGLPTVENYANPALGFVGKQVYVLIDDKETEQHKSPTKEQIAKGQKQGDIMYNPITKKPLTSHYPEIKEFYGIAEIPTTGSL